MVHVDIRKRRNQAEKEELLSSHPSSAIIGYYRSFVLNAHTKWQAKRILKKDPRLACVQYKLEEFNEVNASGLKEEVRADYFPGLGVWYVSGRILYFEGDDQITPSTTLNSENK